MLPDDGTEFTIWLHTNEMIERERFSALLAAIEEVARDDDLGGPSAVLLVASARRGSLILYLALATISGSAFVVIPGVLHGLKKRASDKDVEPNSFAVALGEMMVQDAMPSMDLAGQGLSLTITKEDVPYVKRIAPSTLARISDVQVDIAELYEEGERRGPRSVEDEDQDWVPTIEAKDFSPREGKTPASGFVSMLHLVGAFERVEAESGLSELRFTPHDPTLAPYFVVTSNSYEAEPPHLVDCDIVGNITLNSEGPAFVEIVKIDAPSDEDWLPLRN